MSGRLLLWSVLLTSLLVASCHFEDGTPGGSRPTDTALRALVAEFYQAVGHRDEAQLGDAALPSATALLAGAAGDAALVPVRTLLEVPDRRNEGGGVRISRIDLRPDGSVATARVTVVAVDPLGKQELEATDLLTFAHREGSWRIAQTVHGSWRVRSAP